MSRGRALSVAEPKQGSGLKDSLQKNKAIKMGDRAQVRVRLWLLLRLWLSPVAQYKQMVSHANITSGGDA